MIDFGREPPTDSDADFRYRHRHMFITNAKQERAAKERIIEKLGHMKYYTLPGDTKEEERVTMKKLLKRLWRIFYREPDFIVGTATDPYLHRWWVIPRNKYFNIYLHKFLRSDDDRALHDHPWSSLSIILRGGYIEHLPEGKFKFYLPGAIIYRKATHQHRVELYQDMK